MPRHRYAAGLASSSPRFPSCLPRAPESYAAHVFVSSGLSIQKLRKRPLNGGGRHLGQFHILIEMLGFCGGTVSVGASCADAVSGPRTKSTKDEGASIMVRWSWRRVNVTPEDILSGAQSLEVGARRYEIDVASHCQGSTWSSIHNERRQRMGTVHGYPPLRRVSQVVFYFEPKYEEFRPRTIWSLSMHSHLRSRVQGTGSHYTVQGDSQAGRIPGGPVLRVVLAREAARQAARSHRVIPLCLRRPMRASLPRMG